MKPESLKNKEMKWTFRTHGIQEKKNLMKGFANLLKSMVNTFIINDRNSLFIHGRYSVLTSCMY